MGASSTRAVYEHFLTQQEAQQLLFIHRALAVNGYRPHVRSLALFDLVLAEPRLLPPLVNARQLILDAVEEHFDRPCQVYVEHTSLISWGPGASIGWHHDSNRDYLAQRHFSAVLYLNSKDADFSGGTFCFQSGSGPLRIEPSAGMLLLYNADERNVHQVEPVTAGERATLTMWFTLDPDHQEDKKVLAALSSPAMRGSGLPPTMYQQTPDGPDIRLAQLQQLGVQLVDQQHHHQKQPQQQAPTASHPEEQQQQRQSEGAQQQQQQQQQQKQFALSAAGQQDSSPVAHYSSIQQAALVLNMLQWKLCPHKHLLIPVIPNSTAEPITANHAGNSSAADTMQQQEQPLQQQLEQQSAQDQAHHCGYCGCYTDAKLLGRAGQLLQEYLAAAGEQLEQLLPLWQQLGELVAPAASEQHHIHVLADC